MCINVFFIKLEFKWMENFNAGMGRKGHIWLCNPFGEKAHFLGNVKSSAITMTNPVYKSCRKSRNKIIIYSHH